MNLCALGIVVLLALGKLRELDSIETLNMLGITKIVLFTTI